MAPAVYTRMCIPLSSWWFVAMCFVSRSFILTLTCPGCWCYWLILSRCVWIRIPTFRSISRSSRQIDGLLWIDISVGESPFLLRPKLMSCFVELVPAIRWLQCFEDVTVSALYWSKYQVKRWCCCYPLCFASWYESRHQCLRSNPVDAACQICAFIASYV